MYGSVSENRQLEMDYIVFFFLEAVHTPPSSVSYLYFLLVIIPEIDFNLLEIHVYGKEEA